MLGLEDSIDLEIWFDATKGTNKAKAARLAIEAIANRNLMPVTYDPNHLVLQASVVGVDGILFNIVTIEVAS
jgi:hypothetical protein